MNLNPNWRIPDYLDTVLPSGRTVREVVNDQPCRRYVAMRGGGVLGALARLFGRAAR